jgi:hypothetical protein
MAIIDIVIIKLFPYFFLFLFQLSEQREKRKKIIEGFIGLLSDDAELKKDTCISVVQKVIDSFNVVVKDEVNSYFLHC